MDKNSIMFLYFQKAYINLNMSTWRKKPNRLKEWDTIHAPIMTVH